MNNKFDDILPNNTDNNNRLQELNDALHRDDLSFENEHDFEQDAAEGLKQIKEEDITSHVTALNKGLKEKLKKQKKQQRKIPDQTMVYITIVTLLILVVVAYVVIKKAMQ